ncbi:MAG: long-chain fatty acid--CoA ligase [Nitrospirae bacterium]|nr:MAG: long-chain fatty acid--CoA ligase [Nitrospirota bacterium]
MDPIWIRQYDPGVPAALSYPDSTLPDLLTQAATRYPGRAAIHFYGNEIHYVELDRLAHRFARALRELQMEPGSAVGLMLPNMPQTVIGYYGSLRAGVRVTPINPLYVESEIEHQVQDAGCETIVVLDHLYQRVQPLIGRTGLKRVIVTGVEDYLPTIKRLLYPWQAMKEGQRTPAVLGSGTVRLRDLMTGSDAPLGVLMKPDDVALLQYTGGTTGVPKGVALTHRNLLSNAWQCRSWMPSLREGAEVFLAVLPFFHVYGMSVCQNLAIAVGGCQVLLPRFQMTEVLKVIQRERVTVFPGIPAMYQAINNYQHLERYDLRSIRICISGAGPLPPSVQERFEAITGARLVEGYGLTEASPVTHVNPISPLPGHQRTGSIGLPLPDTQAKVVDMETGDKELPPGEVGELVVRGPQVMFGYWKHEDESRQVLRNGWLYTGDLAWMDAEGFFYIADRKKDMIKSGGENVYPREVEETLLRHGKVKDAVVVGLPQGLRGELIKAYVVLKEGAQASAAEILEHCRQHLAKFKVPKKVEFRQDLPKTLVGKVLRRVLIEEERKKGALKAGDEAE